MRHWIVSSCLGFVLTGRFRPVCSIVWGLPDCRAKDAFARDMNRRFGETRHCGRIHDTFILCDMLRGPIQYDPPPITGRRGPDPGY